MSLFDDFRNNSCELPSVSAFSIRSDCERLSFRHRDRPSWARAMGRDHFGLWAEFVVGQTRQKMRWIPPGRFLMGSPKDEPGRIDDEGPRHEVTIKEGFWLFDTPCTQALWQAVMNGGNNPSRFQSPDRPVEQVGWDDVQTFLHRINDRLPGLDLVLPSEAQWEYACRADTTTALYTGGIEILGQHNAPALDPIAWYGGNSGVGFELDHGHDSSGWPEKQYPHKKTGTHPVGRKAPNSWGLYDMLGNVWEWCADSWHDSYQGAPTDGSPWRDERAGGVRVIRGGSWGVLARIVRSACRGRNLFDNRIDTLGFRGARVHS
ncbi:MAG: formylglycine-generating enzyme family protein [Magnetococcales bacterium]|nr:formylglycine-generating enzyme family protein [Magnetococcales bacterium]